MERYKLEEIVKNSFSISQVRKELNLPANGRSSNKIKELISKYQIDSSHFDKGIRKRKYEKIQKSCPICDNIFIVKRGSKKERTTCSHKCSNSYFRTGPDNGNYGAISDYKKICFRYHARKCCVCDETIALDVHHFDGNHSNNNIENLIPICRNHHMYYHMDKYRHLVIDKINNFRNVYIASLI